MEHYSNLNKQSSSAPNNGAATPHRSDEVNQRAKRIVNKILADLEANESSSLSAKTYSSEPILQTGADFQKSYQQERAGRLDETRKNKPKRHHTSARRLTAVYHHTSAPRQSSLETYLPIDFEAFNSLMHESPDKPHKNSFHNSFSSSFDESFDDYWESSTQVQLPPTLKELRALESKVLPDGSVLRGKKLFVEQARLAADFEDDYEFLGTPRFVYLPTYQELSNCELRGYFSWRSAWRAQQAKDIPYTYAMLLIGELVNSVGCEVGEDCLNKLKHLRTECIAHNTEGMVTTLASDLDSWIRDYAIYYGLDIKKSLPLQKRQFALAVSILRSAERAVLSKENINSDLANAEANGQQAKMPPAEHIWDSLATISSIKPERSAFLNTHPKEAAQVGTLVFEKLAIHYAKRRKTLLVDSLVGPAYSRPFTLFAGLPFYSEAPHADVVVRLSACETVSYRLGRWRLHRGFDQDIPNRELGRIVHEIDRQMRLDWNFGHDLKKRKLPTYLSKIITNASLQVLQEFQELERDRERHTINIDTSKLDKIRYAAAQTREALLVEDEKNDDFELATPPEVASLPAAPLPASSLAIAATTSEMVSVATSETESVVENTPTPTSPHKNAHPCGLSDLEYSALVQALESTFFFASLKSSTPLPAVIVDSINEKFFEEIGDAVVELDHGQLVVIEDYRQDVQDILQLDQEIS